MHFFAFSCSKTHLVRVIVPLCYEIQIIKLGQNAKLLGQILELLGHLSQ